MWVSRQTVTVVTDAGGTGVGYSAALRGFVHGVQYVKTDYADGVSFAVACDLTGTPIWTQSAVNASVFVAPRQPVHNIDGSPVGVGQSLEGGGIAVADERIKITVTSGGPNRTGTFFVMIAT